MWKDLKALVLRESRELISPEEASALIAANIPEHPTREQVLRLQQHLAGLPQVIAESAHYFAEGTYTRVWMQRANVVTVGKIHRLSHTVIILAGDCSLSTEQGFKRVQAPYLEEASAGTKRIVVTHSDCMIATVHPNPTNTRDLEVLEKQLIVDPDSIVQG